jgi:ABC-2 type transport system ATP-binding protein
MKKNEVISCQNVTKKYDAITALNNFSVTINEGEAVAIVGANGAGKTTFFNILLGLTRASEGTCYILGVNSSDINPSVRSKVAFIADHASPVPWASSDDIAKLYSSLYPLWDQHLFVELTASWKIDRKRRLNNLSKGQKRLAELSLVASCQPDIIILDEPFNGLDSVMRIQIQRLLKKLQLKRNKTIVYATHILPEIESVADRMIVLRSGELIYNCSINKMSEPPEEVFVRLYNNEITSDVEL